MHKKIAVLPGDGVGPEIMQQTLRVLSAVEKKYNHRFEIMEADVGGAAFEQYGAHCPDQTLAVCEQADAILFGAVGGPVDQQHLEKWKNCEANSILKLRKAFQFNINIRPVQVYSCLAQISPLKPSVIGDGVDILFYRELCGDIYFGEHRLEAHEASDTAVYTRAQIEPIAHAAFQAARARRSHVTSVDKANVLSTSKLWRQIVTDVAQQYPDVTLQHMLVDNCAMQLVINPQAFDVILTSNLFGDILSDLGAAIPGSLGLIPSASLNQQGFGLYEPAGGSAPDIAGKNKANPIAQMLSAAMMLRHSLGCHEEAQAIERAVMAVLAAGERLQDIAVGNDAVKTTTEFSDAVLSYFDSAGVICSVR